MGASPTEAALVILGVVGLYERGQLTGEELLRRLAILLPNFSSANAEQWLASSLAPLNWPGQPHYDSSSEERAAAVADSLFTQPKESYSREELLKAMTHNSAAEIMMLAKAMNTQDLVRMCVDSARHHLGEESDWRGGPEERAITETVTNMISPVLLALQLMLGLARSKSEPTDVAGGPTTAH